MTERIIKPVAPGLVVRRPENGKPLAAQGEAVEWSAYWQRRLNEGDIIDAGEVPKAVQKEQEQPDAEQHPAAADKKGGAK